MLASVIIRGRHKPPNCVDESVIVDHIDSYNPQISHYISRLHTAVFWFQVYFDTVSMLPHRDKTAAVVYSCWSWKVSI